MKKATHNMISTKAYQKLIVYNFQFPIPTKNSLMDYQDYHIKTGNIILVFMHSSQQNRCRAPGLKFLFK